MIDHRDHVIASTVLHAVLHGQGSASGAGVSDTYVFVYKLRDGLIVEGWEDVERIAAALNRTTEDVAESVRRGMQLLGTPSRTGLAVRTLREGLFLPPRGPSAAG